MRLHLIVRAVMLACCSASAAAVQAGQASLTFPVRVQLLSTCRVAPPPPWDFHLAGALLIRCSHQTPFSARLAAPASTGVAATGRGMGRVSATLPMGDVPTDASAPLPVGVHVSY
ncbi:MAG: hypothetical protein J0I00_05105 [Burkholderiales bacterium]|uniref:hypothetical protein n=1 Tax=Ottowia sp. TaxID=1898956 RepID=UPI001ACBF2F7|nr:hypothetical protein [Ottowia sp.]MBN9404780.1 hypothetical protein [Burkholderiales bacterium]MBS0401892.1 hypothetical protein [Pseudomonadota bacterium]MBS0415500.1 hypothetical protein [Pseudomonadota bacterium]HMN56205.1 hypothetical protein [Ottowia sp.]